MTIWGRIRTFLGRLRPTTIRVRAAALVALLVAVPLSGVAAVAALAVRASLLHQAAPDTRAAAENVALGYQGYDLDIMRSPCEKPLDLWNEAGAPGSVYRFCRWDSMPSAWKELLTGPKGGALSLWPFSSASAYRFVVPDTSEILGRAPDWVLLAENPLLREQTQLRTVVWSLVGAVAFVTALASASAWYAAGRVLRPMEAIRDEFAQLSTHHLDRRVPLPRTDNEISRLGRTLNTTLDRLHAALEQQQRFVADASHELRTPSQPFASNSNSPSPGRPPPTGPAPYATHSATPSACNASPPTCCSWLAWMRRPATTIPISPHASTSTSTTSSATRLPAVTRHPMSP